MRNRILNILFMVLALLVMVSDPATAWSATGKKDLSEAQAQQKKMKDPINLPNECYICGRDV